MTNEIIQSGDGVVHARISGLMTLADQRALEAFSRNLIDAGEKVRVLVTLDAFEGWEKNEAWGDLQFMEYGNEIARIAIVGDEQWKEEASLFLGKGFRATEIEFFPTGSSKAAEAWIRR